MGNAKRQWWAKLMGSGNKVEMLVAICALLTSAMAVFMAWDQGRVMRAQQHGAVYPVLQVDGFISRDVGTVSIGVTVGNSGVGPALVKNVSLIRDGEPIESLDDYVARLPEGANISWSSLNGRALAPGAKMEPMRITWDADRISESVLADTASDWGAVKIGVCYCSVFDKCWRSREFGAANAEAVKQCESGGRDVFAGLGTSQPYTDTPQPEEVE